MKRNNNSYGTASLWLALSIVVASVVMASSARAETSHPMISVLETVPPPGTPPVACAKCADQIRTSDGFWYAAWHMEGEPCGQPTEVGCAQCVPTCWGSGDIGGTWSEVNAWYQENKCAAWQCQDEWLDLDPATLATIDARELASWLQTSYGQLRFNRDRQSIQVYPCQSNVVSRNIALSAAQAAALDAALAELNSSY